MHLSPTIGTDIAEAASASSLFAQIDRVEPVFAVHGYGYPPSQTTFLFEDAKQHRPIGWVKGHRANGSILPADHGHPAYLLTLVERV